MRFIVIGVVSKAIATLDDGSPVMPAVRIRPAAIDTERLNTHMGIVIDSDKKAADGEINATKKRVRDEFEKNSDFVWVTQGKEIENYFKPELIKEILADLYGEDIEIIRYSEYGNCIQIRKQGEKKYKVADKVKLASRFVEKKADLSVLNLNDKIVSLIQYIRKSNGLDSPHSQE